MEWPVESFEARAARIPVHGIGLSVDVFSPDVYADLNDEAVVVASLA